jgi:hypothetical protein
MSISTRMMIENPDGVQVTIKMTMSIKEWTDLRDQLANKWPSSNLSSHITSVVGQMRKVVYAEEAP